MSLRSRFYIGAGMVVVVAALLAGFASKAPDGLNRVAQDHGFANSAAATPVWRLAPLSEYAIPGIHNRYLATGLAGLLGAALVFGATLALGKLLSRRASNSKSRTP